MEPQPGKSPKLEAQVPQINYAEVMNLFWRSPLQGLSFQIGVEGRFDSRAFFLRQIKGVSGFTVITRDGAFRASTGYSSDEFSQAIELAQDGNNLGIEGGYSRVNGVANLRVAIPQLFNRRAIYNFSANETGRTAFTCTLDPLTPEELQETLDRAMQERREREEGAQLKIRELLSPQPVAS